MYEDTAADLPALAAGGGGGGGGTDSPEEEAEDGALNMSRCPPRRRPITPISSNDQDCTTPKEGSPYEAPVYIPDDIPVPNELELRESSVPGAGLGVWAKLRIDAGERFGLHNALQHGAKDRSFSWEVRTTSKFAHLGIAVK
uniref:Si:ch211-263k4.2 n=1 Tax=Neogobius melanostomus TaxID=47308 RepID=A0A8C6SSA3_9GOBI